MQPVNSTELQQTLCSWYDHNGRKTLPWQKPRTAYRVWISEIMLQQTQVSTVIPYFQRFMCTFPNIKALAAASEDEVLSLWAGLGYYARARNLHRTAQIIHNTYNGRFPRDSALLQKLPGIGRSTAGAILALGMNTPAAILDGNVKRVLTRLHAMTQPVNDSKTVKELWQLAEIYTPQKNIAKYTQAIMDLGATVCTPKQPLCTQCPWQTFCCASQTENPAAFPQVKQRKSLTSRSIYFLILRNQQGEILLEKRPPVGIWGGLWSLPECPISADISAWCQTKYHCQIKKIETLPVIQHNFSHFRLEITPQLLQISKWQPPLMESSSKVWYNLKQIKDKGLPAPVSKILRLIL